MPRPTYDVPTPARLVVKLDNGKEWEATEDDLAKFNLVKSLDAYLTFDDRLRKVLIEHGELTEDQEITDAALNPVRYLVEIALSRPDLLDHPEMTETFEEIAAIERVLRESLGPTDTEAAPTPDPTFDELRMHLFTEHGRTAGIGRSDSALSSSDPDAKFLHDHEHAERDCGHVSGNRDWSIRKGMTRITEYHGSLPTTLATMLGMFSAAVDRLASNPNAHPPIEACD